MATEYWLVIVYFLVGVNVTTVIRFKEPAAPMNVLWWLFLIIVWPLVLLLAACWVTSW